MKIVMSKDETNVMVNSSEIMNAISDYASTYDEFKLISGEFESYGLAILDKYPELVDILLRKGELNEQHI